MFADGVNRGLTVALLFGLTAGIFKHVIQYGGQIMPPPRRSKEWAGTVHYNDRFYQPSEVKPPDNY